jgi:hypothetical protein
MQPPVINNRFQSDIPPVSFGRAKAQSCNYVDFPLEIPVPYSYLIHSLLRCYARHSHPTSPHPLSFISHYLSTACLVVEFYNFHIFDFVPPIIHSRYHDEELTRYCRWGGRDVGELRRKCSRVGFKFTR